MKGNSRPPETRGRHWRRFVFALLAFVFVYVLFSVAGGLLLAEWALHPGRLPLRHSEQVHGAAQREFHATVRDVEIRSADDGTLLRGWYVASTEVPAPAVILLHGVSDNREGVAGYASIFLAHGYRVLLPDARAHGESGGTIATYGLRERDDVHAWVSWLKSQNPTQCVYGLGESMGAAIVLQSLAVENRFCAVIAESSFSGFREMAFDRVGDFVGLGPWFGRTLGRAPVEVAFEYARWRYGLDLTRANPADALSTSNTPVLLIHGVEDVNIRPWHSQRLAAVDRNASLWLVPNAVHTGAWAAIPTEFERRVSDWLASHPARPKMAAQ